MTKNISAGFRTHLNLPVTELATCVYIRRKDGVEFRFTDHDVNLVVPGPTLDARGREVAGTYTSVQGQTPTQVKSNKDLAVDNLEILTVLDAASITEADMSAGLWDYADYDIFQVVHSNLSLGVMWLMSGKLGEVTVIRNTSVGVVELRSKSQLLQETIGRLVSHECPVDLGSPDCRVLYATPLRLNTTAYALGDRVRPLIWERREFVCTTAGTTASSEPVWGMDLGDTTTDGTVVWTTYDPLKATEWVASRVYAVNDVIQPTTFDARQYRCTTAGTSGGSEPTWNTTLGGTTNDNTVVWTAELAWFWEGSVTTVTNRRDFKDSTLTDADAAFTDDWFKYGLLIWTTGANAGLESEIKTSVKSDGRLVLWRSMPYTIATSDEFVIEVGCDKAFSTCRDKFNNVVNFQAFPEVPGRDAMLQTPGSLR